MVFSSRKNDLSIGFAAAVLLHAALFCWSAQDLYSTRDFEGEFVRGLTTLPMTVVPMILETMPSADDLQEPEATVIIEAAEPPPPPPAIPLDGGAENALFTPTGHKPPYPQGSKTRGEEGTVLLKLEIDEDGRVLSAIVLESSGYRALDRAAKRAARKTRFVSRANPNETFAGSTEFSIQYELK